MYQVIKRDGRKVDFDLSRIAKAITKAFEAEKCEFHPTVIDYAERYLPQGKEVFFVATHGSKSCPDKYFSAISGVASAKGCTVLGRFACRGYDTFGPFKLIGGMAKGHPDADDLQRARAFIQAL